MGEWKIITGNRAAAEAAKLSRVQVVAAYPITPQTTIVEYIAQMVESGELDAKYIRVESEHSAMAACIGASSVGARAFTATSSHGLLLMHEMLHWAVGARLPIVMAVVNRSIGPPWNIHSEHQDAISQRDTGWLISFASDPQEVLDSIIILYKVCETYGVYLPGFVSLDAFILSHTSMPVNIPSQADVDEFLPPYKPRHYLIDVEDPKTYGNLAFPDRYMELRWSIQKGQELAAQKIREYTREYAKAFGRDYQGLVEQYRTEDAKHLLVTVGAMASEARLTVDKLREEGIKAGLLKIRFYRPFPREDIEKAAEDIESITVIDRNVSFGMGGAIATDLTAVLYGADRNITLGRFIAGLGGRDVTFEHMAQMVRHTLKAHQSGEKLPPTLWFGLREW